MLAESVAPSQPKARRRVLSRVTPIGAEHRLTGSALTR